ncbi:MAG TPA: hypothetical protein VGM51_00480 [Armatimonadota bacterium]|jgi:hypothetical protein
MRNVKVVQLFGLSLAAASLAGCGLFKSSGTSGKLDPNDPNRVVAKMVANVSSLTFFTDVDTGKTATYRATLFDKDGNQFYGPKVQLDGADVTPVTPGDGTSTIYVQGSVAFTPGQTFTTAVQGHSATSPAAIPQMLMTSPVRSTSLDNSTPPKPIQLTYYKQPAGDPMTISWSGGDPSQPVYIFIFGTPDSNTARRLFVSDDPLQPIDDSENFGKPIPNTGTYTIPATLTERYLNSSGAIATRTITTFDDPVTSDTAGRAFSVFVAQRQTADASPIHFGFVSAAHITASVLPKK